MVEVVDEKIGTGFIRRLSIILWRVCSLGVTSLIQLKPYHSFCPLISRPASQVTGQLNQPGYIRALNWFYCLNPAFKNTPQPTHWLC